MMHAQRPHQDQSSRHDQFRTPYRALAKFVSDPVMRVSKNDHVYMTGRHQAFGCDVSLHYRSRNRQYQRPAEFVLKWPFGNGRAEQQKRVFHTLDEVEAFLRPPTQDVSWLGSLPDDHRRVILVALMHSLHDLDGTLTEEQDKVASRLKTILSPDSDMRASDRYDVPADSRYPIWAALVACLDNVHTPQDNMTAEQWELAEKLFSALDQQVELEKAPGF